MPQETAGHARSNHEKQSTRLLHEILLHIGSVCPQVRRICFRSNARTLTCSVYRLVQGKSSEKIFKQEENWLRCRSSSTLCEYKFTQVIKRGENQHWWDLGVFGLDFLLKSLPAQRRILSLQEKTGSGLTTNAMLPCSH